MNKPKVVEQYRVLQFRLLAEPNHQGLLRKIPDPSSHRILPHVECHESVNGVEGCSLNKTGSISVFPTLGASSL